MATTVAYGQPRLGGSVTFSAVHLTLPVASSLTPVIPSTQPVQRSPAEPVRRSAVSRADRPGRPATAALTGPGWVRLAAWVPPSMATTPVQPTSPRPGPRPWPWRWTRRRSRGRPGRDGDLAQSVDDALALEQGPAGVAQRLLGPGLPDGRPGRGQLRVPDDQATHWHRPARRRDRRPPRRRSCPGRSGRRRDPPGPAWVSSRIRARTRSGARRAARRARKPPWDMPPTTARSMPRWSMQAEAVAGRVPVGEGLPVVDGVAEAPLVPGDDPVGAPERGHLVGEHGPVHQEPVGEHAPPVRRPRCRRRRWSPR